MKEIRIGLVGSGWMGKAHSSALADVEMLFGPDYGVASFEIVADANEETAKSAQKKIGFKRISTDWHDVVTDPDVDLVDIATPNAFHYAVAKAVLENGKNVYCEKPLSISAEESKELAELAGCGALGDLGSHLLSISQFIMGNITKVNAVATTVFPKRPKSAGSTEMVDVENEDIMTFMAEYANGAIGQIACSRVATDRKNYLTYEIQGTKGLFVIIWNAWAKFRFTSSLTTSATAASAPSC